MANSHCTHVGGPAYCQSKTCPGRARYLEFKNTTKPLSLSFDDSPAQTILEIPEDVEREIDEIFNYAHEIEFLNHGDSKDEYLTVQDIIDNNKLIRGNCLAVTHGIIENHMLNDDYEVSAATLAYEKGYHAAVQIKHQDETMILDFTMRQFDSEAPLPYIGRRAEWEEKIDSYIESIWLDKRKSE
jgi:hypothetical protein